MNNDQIRDAYKKGYTDAQLNIVYSGESIAQALTWDGHAITAAFLDALTDANFHQLRDKLEPIINQHLGDHLA